MKSKKILPALIILFLVAAIFIVVGKLNDRKPSDSKTKFFPGLEEQAITSLLIREGETSVKISKKGASWVVAKQDQTTPASVLETPPSEQEKQYTADSASVQIALEKLVTMKKSDLVSENPEKQSLFEVDSTSGVYVEVWKSGDNSAGALRIGKSGPDWNSNYIRMMGNNSVYAVPGGLRNTLYSDLNRWREKRIVRFESSAASQIALVKRDGSGITLEKKDDGWSITNPIQHKAAEDKVNGIIHLLSSLRAADFVYDKPEESVSGLEKPALTVTVLLNGGAQRTVLIGNIKEESSQHWAKVDDKEEIFLIASHDMETLTTDVEALKVEEVLEEVTPAVTGE